MAPGDVSWAMLSAIVGAPTGALAVIRYARRRGTKPRPWLTALLARRPTKLAAIALANKEKRRYVVLAPFMSEQLDRKLIETNWDDVQRVISAFHNRVVAPSLILRKLGTTPRQGALSLAMREIGRIERTLHTLDWIENLGLRADTTDVLNKGEARHTRWPALLSSCRECY
jgi:TnpA family transposase